jgi:cobalt/nickel transport system permease protein
MRVAAMHAPDGFINAPVSAIAWIIAIAAIAVCLRGARKQLDERTAPLAGLVAVFVFAMQMINFPVGAGTSGHLLGGALAVILVGPYAGTLAVVVVVIVQALLFADGGLTALGINIINMALVTAIVGWFVFRLVVRLAGSSKPAVAAGAFLAGFLSVPASALAFVAEYAIGGTGTINLELFFAAMFGVHMLIGIGEGIITALVVIAVYLARPDLVFGIHDRMPQRLEHRQAATSKESS